MIFNSIELTNFRQFKNIKIDFSKDPLKNVTFITGEITSGKSTLIKSFLWCLYRDVMFDDKILLSQVERDIMVPGKDRQVKVEIDLEHNHYVYRITTSESYFIDKFGKVGIRDRASTKLIKISPEEGSSTVLINEAADLEINDILKKDLAPYFFFDGETSNIEKLVESKNLKQAISDIMGLKPIETLKKITNDTTSDGVYQLIQRELKSVDNAMLDKIKMENIDLQTSKDSLESEVEDHLSEIKTLTEEKVKIESIIEANKDVENDVEEKRRLSFKTENLRKSIDEDYEEVKEMINNPDRVFPLLLSNVFMNYSFDELLNSSKLITNKSLTDINSIAIDQIIERGYCVCGQKITEGSTHLEHLIDQKNYIAPKNYGKAIENFLSNEKENIKKANSFRDTFNRKMNELRTNIESIEKAKKSIAQIIERIQNRHDVLHFKTKLNENESSIKMLESMISNKQGRIDEKTDSIRKNNENIKRLTENTSGNSKINERLTYVGEIFNATSDYLDRKIKTVLDGLNKYVSEAFKIMFSGERKIAIDENFRVKTYLKNGNSDLEESSGLKTVKNFSFVSGLIKCSKEFSIKKDEMEDGFDGKHPLVMDAPFSKLGEDPIKRVSKQIPEMCDQIIIFVLNKDFQISRESMHSRIGKEYKITKITEKESIVEVF